MGDTDANSVALKEKQEEIEKLTATMEKEKTRVANAEKKFAEWGNELGEIRKDKDALRETLTEAQKTIQELKLVVEGRAKTPEGGEGTDKGKKPDEKPEDIEKELNEDQKKLGEATFEALTEEEKIQYASDPKFKTAFLKRLKTDAPLVPKSPWTTVKEAEPKGKSGVDTILDRVFAKKNKASFVPEGPDARIPFLPHAQGKKPEFVEDSRVH